ncbi:MAG: Hsp20/alpha crystallin family protein [Candidatus Sumerlaeaceae bacterium]|nr:Hsp20/alpha crystallin family protein [Candidatus Sumerlaeaceae bacterium]
MTAVKKYDSGLVTLEAQPDDLSDSSVFGRVLDNFFSLRKTGFWPSSRAWIPPTDVFETDDCIVIRMEIAGVAESDIEVKVSDNFLIVRGRRLHTPQAKNENYHLMEIHYGPFERVFRLPDSMELRDVSAVLRDGFLTVTIPRGAQQGEIRINIE